MAQLSSPPSLVQPPNQRSATVTWTACGLACLAFARARWPTFERFNGLPALTASLLSTISNSSGRLVWRKNLSIAIRKSAGWSLVGITADTGRTSINEHPPFLSLRSRDSGLSSRRVGGARPRLLRDHSRSRPLAHFRENHRNQPSPAHLIVRLHSSRHTAIA